MNIILSMAVSANGIIASKSGSEEFLSDANWHEFVSLAKQVGCFIWGRKTYEMVAQWEGNYLDDLSSLRKVVISRSALTLKPGFDLAHSPEEAVRLLEESGFTTALITGGATINSAFAQSGLIDEVIFDVNPILVGEGFPIFRTANFQLPLTLIGVDHVDDQIVKLKYRVKK